MRTLRATLATSLAVVIAAAACSSSSVAVPPASTTDASTNADGSLVCGTADGGSMRCHAGDACHCDDRGFTGPMCVDGAWKCAPGTTRAEDCYGVPPIKPCVIDDAGVGHGIDAGDGG